MFPEDRPAVVNMRWRGKYPRIVTRLVNVARIRPGVYCNLWGAPENPNNGRLVYVVGKCKDLDWLGYWEVKAIGEPLVTFDRQDMSTPVGTKMQAMVPPHRLRRCLDTRL